MPNKIFNIRLRNKRDTEANWEKKDPLILDGETIVVTTASGETRVKIGDGAKNYTQLPFLDEVLKNEINNKAAIDAGVYTAVASSSDGVAYTATVPGIESLSSGASFIMIPDKTSASKEPTIDVNGLGAKKIRRRLSAITTSLQSGYSNTWISINKPFQIVYDGAAWVVEGMPKPVGADVYGAVPQATADASGNVITDTYATIAMLQNMLPKVTTITLASGWNGTASPYYQDVTLSCATETSVVDLQPTPAQLASWQDSGLAFTGAVTGEYDGTTDISVDIPSDVYIAQINATSGILVNDYDELVSAIRSHKIIILLIGETAGLITITVADFDSTKVTLGVPEQEYFINFTIAKDTKKLAASYLYHFSMEIQEGVDPKSGVVYFDEATGLCSTKDSVSPIATTSTAGTIKVGNGLSISDDGTLSVTTATYYTGTADPVNTLGADGDLYLQTGV